MGEIFVNVFNKEKKEVEDKIYYDDLVGNRGLYSWLETINGDNKNRAKIRSQVIDNCRLFMDRTLKDFDKESMGQQLMYTDDNGMRSIYTFILRCAFAVTVDGDLSDNEMETLEIYKNHIADIRNKYTDKFPELIKTAYARKYISELKADTNTIVEQYHNFIMELDSLNDITNQMLKLNFDKEYNPTPIKDF